MYDSSDSTFRPVVRFICNKGLVLRLGVDFNAKREHVLLIALAPFFPATAKFQMYDGGQRLTLPYRLKLKACL